MRLRLFLFTSYPVDITCNPVAIAPGTDPVAIAPGTDPVAIARGTDPVAIARGTDPVATGSGTDPAPTLNLPTYTRRRLPWTGEPPIAFV